MLKSKQDELKRKKVTVSSLPKLVCYNCKNPKATKDEKDLLVCVDRECCDRYGEIVCEKCHESSHTISSGLSTVQLVQMIGDFSVFLDGFEQIPVKLSQSIAQNLQQIDKLMVQLNSLREAILDSQRKIQLHDRIVSQFNQIQSDSLKAKCAASKQLLRLCVYDPERSDQKVRMVGDEKTKQLNHNYMQKIQGVSHETQSIKYKLSQMLAGLKAEPTSHELQQQEDGDQEEQLEEQVKRSYLLTSSAKRFLEESTIAGATSSTSIDWCSRIKAMVEEGNSTISQIKGECLAEINRRIQSKGINYSWKHFDAIQMHLSARKNEVQGYFDCSISDNGFDRLWVAGGHTNSTFYADQLAARRSVAVSSFSVSPNKSGIHKSSVSCSGSSIIGAAGQEEQSLSFVYKDSNPEKLGILDLVNFWNDIRKAFVEVGGAVAKK